MPYSTITLLAVLVLPGVKAPIREDPQPGPADRLRAAIVWRLAQYVAWPEKSFEKPSDPFVLCVIGRDPVEPVLRGFANEKSKVNGHPLEVRRALGGAGLDGAHLVFIPDPRQALLGDVLEALEGRPVLVVGESPGLGVKGAMVNLIAVPGGRTGLELNREALEKAGLKADAKLSALSRKPE